MNRETKQHVETIKQTAEHKGFAIEIDIVTDKLTDVTTISMSGEDGFKRTFYARSEGESANIHFQGMKFDADIANEITIEIENILLNL